MATLVSYQFFHADIGHLLGNMIFLWVFGDDIERALGRMRFLAFYLFAASSAGSSSSPMPHNRRIELIGASGAVAGVVIGYIMLRPCAKITVLLGHHSAADQRLLGDRPVRDHPVVESRRSLESEVAYWCHFGGMVAGGILFPLHEAAVGEAVRVQAADAGYRGADRPRSRCPRGAAGPPPLTPRGVGH